MDEKGRAREVFIGGTLFLPFWFWLWREPMRRQGSSGRGVEVFSDWPTSSGWTPWISDEVFYGVAVFMSIATLLGLLVWLREKLRSRN
jgi:hypothetical protein